MPRLSRPLGLLLAMAGVAAGFGLILIIGSSPNPGQVTARAPVFDKNGFPAPVAAAAAPQEPSYPPGDTRLDMIARTLLPGPAFKTYSVVILPLSAVVAACVLGLALRTRLRRQARNAGAMRTGTKPPPNTAQVAKSPPEPDPGGPLLTSEQLRQRVERLARSIQAPLDKLPTYGRPRDFGYPHIEIDEAYHWIVTERGQELKRLTTRDLDELLYFIFQSATFSMALDIEARRRRKGEDSRRQLFEVQLELLGRLSPAWAARRKAELDEVLVENPFVDR